LDEKNQKTYLYVIIAIFIIALDIIGFMTIKNKRIVHNLTSGNKYLAEGDYNNAQLAFQKVLKRREDNVDALLGIGKAYLLKGDYTRAAEQFNKAIENNKKNKDIYIKIESIYEENNRLDDAMKIVRLGYLNTDETVLKDRDAATVDTSKPGNYVIEGKVEGFERAVKLNLQVKEVIKPISNKEILSLVINAHNSLMEIIDDYKGQEKIDLIRLDDNDYIALPTEFNSYNKLYVHFNKYWSAEASKQLIKLLDAKTRNGIYSRRFGEIGLGYFNTIVAEIESKSVNGKKVTVKINSVDSVNDPTQFIAELIYSEGRWWVNYWQWGFELLG
jgi:tetratricopeptide (TPR) repeat protein